MTKQKPVWDSQKDPDAVDSLNGTRSRRDADRRGLRERLVRRGGAAGGTQRQFQFRNLSDDPRLNLRLDGILES
jgi:hypothetical protein